MKQVKLDAIDRIIDANINRLKEGLRVCEEVARFILESRSLTEELKVARHKVDNVLKRVSVSRYAYLRTRDSMNDIGKAIGFKKEFRRNDYKDVLFANMQRSKESLRVLEEFFKIKDAGTALKFKRLRYEIYAVEKKIIGKLPALRHPR